jgi:hypothetical protein
LTTYLVKNKNVEDDMDYNSYYGAFGGLFQSGGAANAATGAGLTMGKN